MYDGEGISPCVPVLLRVSLVFTYLLFPSSTIPYREQYQLRSGSHLHDLTLVIQQRDDRNSIYKLTFSLTGGYVQRADCSSIWQTVPSATAGSP